MADFNYSLKEESYSWQNALLWGNFLGHCKKAKEGTLGNRVVHALIAATEFLPVIGQISSICERLIVLHFAVPKPKMEGLDTKKITVITEKIDVPPLPAQNSETQQKKYKREELVPLDPAVRNIPIALSSLPKRVKSCSENATFYSYNAEGIRDYGFGCAWRAIQTCLSTYKIEVSFETLFHTFGPIESLKRIYQEKYPEE